MAIKAASISSSLDCDALFVVAALEEELMLLISLILVLQHSIRAANTATVKRSSLVPVQEDDLTRRGREEGVAMMVKSDRIVSNE